MYLLAHLSVAQALNAFGREAPPLLYDFEVCVKWKGRSQLAAFCSNCSSDYPGDVVNGAVLVVILDARDIVSFTLQVPTSNCWQDFVVLRGSSPLRLQIL
jgi:hypothetical protein